MANRYKRQTKKATTAGKLRAGGPAETKRFTAKAQKTATAARKALHRLPDPWSRNEFNEVMRNLFSELDQREAKSARSSMRRARAAPQKPPLRARKPLR